MSKSKTSPDDRLSALNAEIARLQARAKDMAASKRARETRSAQRRAFLIGEAISAEATIPEHVRRYLAGVLDRHTKRPSDRELLHDFLGEIECAVDANEAAA